MLNKLFYNEFFYHLARVLVPFKRIRKKIKEHIRYKIDHPKICAYMSKNYVEPFSKGELEHFSFERKKDLKDEKVLWVFWHSGKENAPLIAQGCFLAMQKYMSEYKIIFLDEKNLKEYISFPNFIYEKIEKNFFGEKTITFFSDLLRLALLHTYGGVWLDATIFLSAKIPNDLLKKDFFVFKKKKKPSKDELEKVLHSRYFAYSYFNYNDDFKVKMFSAFIIAKSKNPFISAMLDILMAYWQKDEGKHHFYFLIHIVYELLKEKGFKNENYHISDFELHLLQFHALDFYDEELWQEIQSKSFVHKLTYFKDIKENSMINKIVLEQ